MVSEKQLKSDFQYLTFLDDEKKAIKRWQQEHHQIMRSYILYGSTKFCYS